MATFQNFSGGDQDVYSHRVANIIFITAGDEMVFIRRWYGPDRTLEEVRCREVRVKYDPEKFRISWEVGEKEAVIDGPYFLICPNPGPLSWDEAGKLVWKIDFYNGMLVLPLPHEWVVRDDGSLHRAKLVRASDRSPAGELPVRTRNMIGPNGPVADTAAEMDQGDKDAVVLYSTGRNGRTANITIPLPNGGGTHTFVWEASKGSKGAEKLPPGWFYGVGREVSSHKDGTSGGGGGWYPAEGNGLSDFSSESMRVVDAQTYQRLLAAVPTAA
jgi:hypothetical protein